LILVTDPPQLMPATDRISCVYFTAPKTDTFYLKSNLPSTTEQWWFYVMIITGRCSLRFLQETGKERDMCND